MASKSYDKNCKQRRLTDDCEHVLAECGLEERRLARDLAAEAARRVQVHAPQHDVSLARLAPLQLLIQFEFGAQTQIRDFTLKWLQETEGFLSYLVVQDDSRPGWNIPNQSQPNPGIRADESPSKFHDFVL